MAKGSAPAPWDSPMSHRYLGRGRGRVQDVERHGAPGIAGVLGEDPREAGAGLPSVSEIPPSPGVPTDCSSVATTAPDSVDTSVATSGSAAAWSPMFSVTSEPGGDVDALVGGGSQVARRRRHQRDVDDGVGGGRVEQRQDEPAALGGGAVGEVPIGGGRRRARRHAPSERALDRLATPPRRPRRAPRPPRPGSWSRAAGAHRQLAVGGTRSATVRAPAHGAGCARAGRERGDGGQRAVHRSPPALVSTMVAGAPPWAPLPPAQNQAEDSVPARRATRERRTGPSRAGAATGDVVREMTRSDDPGQDQDGDQDDDHAQPRRSDPVTSPPRLTDSGSTRSARRRRATSDAVPWRAATAPPRPAPTPSAASSRSGAHHQSSHRRPPARAAATTSQAAVSTPISSPCAHDPAKATVTVPGRATAEGGRRSRRRVGPLDPPPAVPSAASRRRAPPRRGPCPPPTAAGDARGAGRARQRGPPSRASSGSTPVTADAGGGAAAAPAPAGVARTAAPRGPRRRRTRPGRSPGAGRSAPTTHRRGHRGPDTRAASGARGSTGPGCPPPPRSGRA